MGPGILTEGPVKIPGFVETETGDKTPVLGLHEFFASATSRHNWKQNNFMFRTRAYYPSISGKQSPFDVNPFPFLHSLFYPSPLQPSLPSPPLVPLPSCAIPSLLFSPLPSLEAGGGLGVLPQKFFGFQH